jgi:hypothetical protein
MNDPIFFPEPFFDDTNSPTQLLLVFPLSPHGPTDRMGLPRGGSESVL